MTQAGLRFTDHLINSKISHRPDGGEGVGQCEGPRGHRPEKDRVFHFFHFVGCCRKGGV